MAKYGRIKKQNVFIMEKVKVPKDYVAIQSLKTGDTAVVKKKDVKILKKYPGK